MRKLFWLAVGLLGCNEQIIDGGGDPVCPASCGPGKRCEQAVCIDDCRLSDAPPCEGTQVCDFTDGQCRAAGSECLLTGAFEACGQQSCGPGTGCLAGKCVAWLGGCTSTSCDASGRCWGTYCPCERHPVCSPASLDRLNQADFAGSQVNMSDNEGAFDLDFDELCNAYSVTMISGPDYLRQLGPDGKFQQWTSTTNLNMGQVAVLRINAGEFATIGDIAATYICCATCGCVETGADGRLGVVHLDRASAQRPLPNVIPASSTSGTGPFGNPTLDTGPYGLAWGGDSALYIGNIKQNGDFYRVDLATLAQKQVATFGARVVAAQPYDPHRLLVATVGGDISLLDTNTGEAKPFAKLAAEVLSVRRDRFTAKVYAEIRTSPPQIIELSPDGGTQTLFQTAPRVGRIAISPDGFLYHLSVFPAVRWKSQSAIVRWPLPQKR